MNEVTFEINGTIDNYGWQRYNVRYFLKQNKGKAVRVKINSWGGSVNEALAISKLFEEHGNVTVEFVGFCASAVTWMAFGAKRIEMHEDSLWLCHKSTITVDIYGQLNADDLEATITKLQNEKKNNEAVDLIIAKKYNDRCKESGKTLKDVFDLMKQERWLNAEEVKSWGFIDTVIPGINKANNEYRAMMAENCASIGFPMIPVSADQVAHQEETEKKSLVESIVEGIKALFNSNKEQTNPQNTEPMKKTIENVSLLVALLAVNEIVSEDGKITLTEEQAQMIEDQLKALQSAQAENKAVKEALDAISDNIKAVEGTENKVKAVAAVINAIPVWAPAGVQVPPSERKDEVSTSADAVYSYLKEQE